MAFSERLALIITASADQAIREVTKVGSTAERELGKATSSSEKFASTSLKIGAGLVAGGGVALVALSRLGQGASAVNEQISGGTVVFREHAREVETWSRGLASSFGIAQRTALTFSNNFGSMFVGLGIARTEAADMSKTLIELSADLASFKDIAGGPEEVLQRLRSGLAGEAEPLRNLGIFLNEAAVKAKAMELGIADASDELTDAQKIQARYALILEQSSLAQGDFARTSDSLANSQRIAAAEAENAKNAFGQGVVGPMTAATKAVGGTVRAFGELSPEMASTVGTIATIGAAAAVGVGGLALLAGGVTKAKLAFDAGDSSVNNFGKAAKGLGVVAGVVGTLAAVSGGLDALGVSARGLDLDLDQLGKTTDRELVAAFRKLGDLEGEAGRFFDALPLDQAQRLVAALKATGEETGALEAKVKARAKAEAEAASSTDKAKGALDELTGATEDNTEATLDAVKAAKDLADQRERILDATLAAVDAEQAYANAFDSLEDAQTDAAEKQQAYNDAVKAHGRNSAEARAANEELEDSHRNLAGEYLSVASAAAQLASDQADAEGRTLSAADKYRIYRDELIKLKDQLAPGSALRVHLEGVINKLPPPEVKFSVIANTTQADAALEKLRQQWLAFSQANPGAQGPSLFGPVGTGTTAPTPAPPKTVSTTPIRYRHAGGPIDGADDEVPIVAQRGEFVVRRAAVDKIGVAELERLNRFHKGGHVGPRRAAAERPDAVAWWARGQTGNELVELQPRGLRFRSDVRLDPSQVDDRRRANVGVAQLRSELGFDRPTRLPRPRLPRFHDGGPVGAIPAASAPVSVPARAVTRVAGDPFDYDRLAATIASVLQDVPPTHQKRIENHFGPIHGLTLAEVEQEADRRARQAALGGE